MRFFQTYTGATCASKERIEMADCICIRFSDGEMMKVVGCPVHGATKEQVEEIVKEALLNFLKHKADCQCALCKPPEKK